MSCSLGFGRLLPLASVICGLCSLYQPKKVAACQGLLISKAGYGSPARWCRVGAKTFVSELGEI